MTCWFLFPSLFVNVMMLVVIIHNKFLHIVHIVIHLCFDCFIASICSIIISRFSVAYILWEEFICFNLILQKHKCVPLEDIAAEFKLRTQVFTCCSDFHNPNMILFLMFVILLGCFSHTSYLTPKMLYIHILFSAPCFSPPPSLSF